MKTGIEPLMGDSLARQPFAYPFRIFFLSVGCWAVVIVPLWLALLKGSSLLQPPLPALVWHQHEMLFGLLNAAIAGFLLTAVCVWTRTERLHGLPLMGLWGVWAAGRILLLAEFGLPGWLVLAVNLLFLPLVMLDAGRRIVGAGQWRQLMILVVLGMLWLMQLGLLLTGSNVYAHGGLLMALALMLIIGGRITPAFTANWLRGQGHDPARVRKTPRLDPVLPVLALLLLASVLSGLGQPGAGLALLLGILSLYRLWQWRGWLTWREPLLWMLHLSLLWIPLALFLLGAQLAGWLASTVWVHAAGVGAMGGLILGVVCRVALGHTGRPLLLPRLMVPAFFSLHLAALLRVLTALGWVDWNTGLLLSGLLWVMAFGLFVVRFVPILARPRIDGLPG